MALNFPAIEPGSTEFPDAAGLINPSLVVTGSAEEFTSADPVLALGQRGRETDTGQEKVGDGSTAWTGLGYVPVTAETMVTAMSDLEAGVRLGFLLALFAGSTQDEEGEAGDLRSLIATLVALHLGGSGVVTVTEGGLAVSPFLVSSGVANRFWSFDADGNFKLATYDETRTIVATVDPGTFTSSSNAVSLDYTNDLVTGTLAMTEDTVATFVNIAEGVKVGLEIVGHASNPYDLTLPAGALTNLSGADDPAVLEIAAGTFRWAEIYRRASGTYIVTFSDAHAVGSSSAPSLSNAVDAANGPTAATGSVDTNTGDGTLYWVALLTADSTPSASEVEAGQKSGGGAAEDSGSQSVSGTGTQSLAPAPTMLSPETGYKIAYMHKNAGGFSSAVVVADGFTTPALLVGEADGGGGSTANPTAVTASIAVEVGDLIIAVSSEQSSAVTVTGVTDNLGNTYAAPDGDGHVAGGITGMMAFYSIATNAGTLTAVNFAATASGNDIALKIAVFKGPFSEIDAAPALVGDGSSSFTSSASGALAQASELAVGVIAVNSAADPVAASSPWTLAGAVASGGLRRAAIEYQNLEATSSVSASFTGTNASAAVGVMTFKRSV